MKTTNEVTQLYGLDILKFGMAIIVVSIHSLLFVEYEPLFNLVNPLKMAAVPAFFIISSFLFFRKISNEYDGDNGSVLKHYIRRMLLFYLFWFIIMLPMTFVVRKWYIHFDIIRFLRSLFLSSTFRGSYFIMALIIGVPIIYYLRKILHPISILLITFPVYLLFLYSDCVPINTFGEVSKSLHFSFMPNLIWISIGNLLSLYRMPLIRTRTSLITLAVFYIIAQVPNMEPLMRPVFSVTLFLLFLNVKVTEKPVYVVLRKLSILIFVIHFFFNSGYFYLAEGKFPILNHSILHFIVILSCTIIVSGTILRLKDRPFFKWLRYGL